MRRALFALVLLAAVPASADVVDPEVEACQGKAAGDACGGGACVESTCSRARPVRGPNGEMDVQSSSWPCLRCDPDASPPGPGAARIAIGIAAGAVLVGGGVWLALRKSKD